MTKVQPRSQAGRWGRTRPGLDLPQAGLEGEARGVEVQVRHLHAAQPAAERAAHRAVPCCAVPCCAALYWLGQGRACAGRPQAQLGRSQHSAAQRHRPAERGTGPAHMDHFEPWLLQLRGGEPAVLAREAQPRRPCKPPALQAPGRRGAARQRSAAAGVTRGAAAEAARLGQPMLQGNPDGWRMCQQNSAAGRTSGSAWISSSNPRTPAGGTNSAGNFVTAPLCHSTSEGWRPAVDCTCKAVRAKPAAAQGMAGRPATHRAHRQCTRTAQHLTQAPNTSAQRPAPTAFQLLRERRLGVLPHLSQLLPVRQRCLDKRVAQHCVHQGLLGRDVVRVVRGEQPQLAEAGDRGGRVVHVGCGGGARSVAGGRQVSTAVATVPAAAGGCGLACGPRWRRGRQAAGAQLVE